MPHLGFVVLVVTTLLIGGCTKKKNSIELKTPDEKLSYVIGQQIGNGLKAQGFKVDTGTLAQSIDDAINGTPSKMTPQEMQQVMMNMQQERMAKQQGESKVNKAAGDQFLTANKAKPGVKVLKSGLQYEVMNEGKGAIPKASETVRVHYKGTLTDGSEFDSSHKRGQPAEFPVLGVIKGWTEALQMMKVGSKWKLVVPADLAYGEQMRPGIPPNSVLIFEVELIEIIGKKEKIVAPVRIKTK